jgi:hypothetical protein
MEGQMGTTTGTLAMAVLLAVSTGGAATAQDFDSFAPGSHQALRFERQSHASSRQNVAMLRLAHERPEQFIGKMLMLNDGRKAGAILSVRRNRDDKLLYLIIQAEPYFKERVEFAVPVLDVDQIRDHIVILTTLPGNFLRGMEYEIAEFQDADTYADWPLVVDQ